MYDHLLTCNSCAFHTPHQIHTFHTHTNAHTHTQVQRVERVDDEPLQKVNEAELTELEMRLRTAGVPDV